MLFAVEFSRKQLPIRWSVDQLNGDPDPIASDPDGPFRYSRRTKFTNDFRHGWSEVPIPKRRCARVLPGAFRVSSGEVGHLPLGVLP